MKFLNTINRYFWVHLLIAIVLGFLFPQHLQSLEGIVLYIMIATLFLVFLKVKYTNVIQEFKKPVKLLYIVLLNMILIPAVIYVLFKPVDPNLRMALVLLAALPAGIPTAVFTDIMEDGQSSFTIMIMMVTTLVAPFTIPLVFWMLYHQTFGLDLQSLFLNLLLVLVIPFVAAQILRKACEPIVNKSNDVINALVLLCTSLIIMIVMAMESQYILTHKQEVFYILGSLYGAFLLIQLMGYFGAYWLKKGEKVAISNSNVMMNQVLGIIVSLAIFDPKIALVVIVATIPWNTMIMVFHWYKKYLP